MCAVAYAFVLVFFVYLRHFVRIQYNTILIYSK